MNGALVPLEDAAVSPLDHGLVVGDGVFETLRVYDGVPFAWTRHLARLHASAAGLGLDRARRRRAARAAADAVLAANALARSAGCASPSPVGPRRPARGAHRCRPP